jgi:hypothetical protein
VIRLGRLYRQNITVGQTADHSWDATTTLRSGPGRMCCFRRMAAANLRAREAHRLAQARHGGDSMMRGVLADVAVARDASR